MNQLTMSTEVDTTGSHIRRWLEKQQLNVVATPSRLDQDKAHRLGSEGYCLTLREIHDFELPNEVQQFREENSEKDLSVRLHVTFFDFATNNFYGNTYISPEIALPDPEEDDDVPWDLKQLIYFTSTRNNTKCYAIIEIVGTTFDRATTSERTYSLAWAALPLFVHRNMRDMDEVDHINPYEEDFDTSRLFAGTPRSLLFFGDNWKSKAPPLNHKKRGCKIMFSMHTCLNLLKAQHLLPHDFAFGPTTTLPGLEPVLLPGTVVLTPALYAKAKKRRPWTKPAVLKLDTPSLVDLSNFTLTLPRGMDAAVRRQIAAMPFTGVQREFDDLSMVVRVGVHNGVGLTVPPDAGGRGGGRGGGGGLGGDRDRDGFSRTNPWMNIDMREGSRGVYRASMRRNIPHWFKDARCALVFEVVYTTKSGGGAANVLRRSRDRELEGRNDIMGSREGK